MRSFAGNRAERPGIALAVLCVAQFVVVLDATIVATAAPTIGADLAFAPASLTWVITAYTVVLAGLLLLGGRAADVLGARQIFRAGLAVFSAASLACAAAWSPAALIAARVAQGLGAALLAPAALAALSGVVEASAVKARALGWWTAAGAGGGASGWVLGGVITELAGWRWVFAVNVPIGLLALLLSIRVLPLRPEGRRRASLTATSLDLAGGVSVSVGCALACLGLARLGEHPRHLDGWALTALAAAALALFARHERRTDDPLVPEGLLRRPGVLGGNLTAATLTGSTTPAMLTVILYVQHTVQLSPAKGSLLFPAFNLAVIGGSLAGPTLIARAGVRTLLLGGFAAVVGGIALLLTLPGHGVPVLRLLAAFAVMGAGLGGASVASTTAGTAELRSAERGVGAGLLNSTAQLGQALGLAAITPVVASASPMTGYRLGYALAAGVAVVGTVAAAVTVRGRPTSPTPAPAASTSSSY